MPYYSHNLRQIFEDMDEEDYIFHTLKDGCYKVFCRDFNEENASYSGLLEHTDEDGLSSKQYTYKHFKSKKGSSTEYDILSECNVNAYIHFKPLIEITKNTEDNSNFTIDNKDIFSINKLVKKIKVVNARYSTYNGAKRLSIDELRTSLTLLEAVSACLFFKYDERMGKQKRSKVRFRLPYVGQL